jgi:Fe-S-cluster containining protein
MKTLPPVSYRERICLSCRDKTCCSYYTVTVRAQDLLRIARNMQLAPSDFLSYHALPEGERGGFLLDPAGPGCALTLMRRSFPGDTAAPCIFLLRTNDQHGRCGLGDLRPGQCRTYPSYFADSFVAVAHFPAGCVRTWSYGDMDLEEERKKLRHARAEEAVHEALVEEWNQRVRSEGRERSCDEFCTFLVNRVQEQEAAV